MLRYVIIGRLKVRIFSNEFRAKTDILQRSNSESIECRKFFSKLLYLDGLHRRFISRTSVLHDVEDLRSTWCHSLWGHFHLLCRKLDIFCCRVSDLLCIRRHFTRFRIASLMRVTTILCTITGWIDWFCECSVEQRYCCAEIIHMPCSPLRIATVELSLQEYWMSPMLSGHSCCHHYSKYLVNWNHTTMYVLCRKEYAGFCFLLCQYAHDIYSNGIHYLVRIFSNLCSTNR